MKDTSRLTAAEVNQRYSKSANLAVRTLLLNGEGWVFRYFKTLDAAITNEVLEGRGLDLDRWVQAACGHC